jgi:long-chain acyl-CoA synthetase
MVADLAPALVVWQEAEIGSKVAEIRDADERDPVAWIRADTPAPDGWDALVAAQPDTDQEEPVDPASPLLLIYTAAFGGRPRAAQLDHHSLVLRSLCEALAQGLDHDFVYLNNGPMFHVGNWRTMMPTYLLGGRNVFIRRADPDEMCRLVDAEGCTGAYLVPILREQMAQANRDGRYRLTSLRDNAGDAGWRAMVTAAPAWSGYGQTETGGLVATSALGPPTTGGAGRTLPLVQLRILDEEGAELSTGEVGEIAVRGPVVTSGYRETPREHGRFRGGWWRTGDLGRREPDGGVTFVGTRTRMLKSGSENIYPAEVEACLRTHPAVAECAIIGTPDPVWTQNVRAIVVVRGGRRVTEAELVEHCRAAIGSYKKPRTVLFVEALPRRDGRIDTDALDARYGGGGYPGSGAGTGRSGA